MKQINKRHLRKMYKLINIFIIILFISCSKTEPPPTKPPAPEPEITLAVEDTSAIEAWIKITTNNIQLPTTVTLKKNNTVEQTISLLTQDSVIYIDSLLPNTTYTFQAIIQSQNQQIESNELSVETMDTTSHNFTWQTFTFGEHSSSVLNDVAIIDENNIWAVGEIFMNDSLGNPDPTFYNAAHWNGQEWDLKRILYGGWIWTIKTIFAFSANDIWFSAFVRYDGQNFIELPIPPILTGWSINKIWGTSSNDLYVVGNNGNIAHRINGQWKKIESGTDLDINDIWGDYNERTLDIEINLVAGQHFISPERKILTIINDVVEELSTANIAEGSLSGIWFKSGKKYFVVGNGIYKINDVAKLNDWDASLDSLTPYYSYAVNGSDLNNIFICGSFGDILHFNGRTWRGFRNIPGFYEAEFFNLYVKKGIVAVVGQRFNSGFIVTGKSQ